MPIWMTMLLDLLGIGAMFAKRRTIVFAVLLLVAGAILLHGAGAPQATPPPFPDRPTPTVRAGEPVAVPAVALQAPADGGRGETIAGAGMVVVGSIFLVLALRDMGQGRRPRD